jgi:hypothetical protein
VSEATDLQEWNAYQEYQRQLAIQRTQQAIQDVLGPTVAPTVTGGEFSQVVNMLTEQQRDPLELRLLVASQFQNKLPQLLQNPEFRDEFRAMLRGDAEALQNVRSDLGATDRGTSGRDFSQTLAGLNRIPVPFIRPDISVSREEVDTPEKQQQWLLEHHAADPLNTRLLQAALEYGGLAIEPTPYGVMRRPGGGLEWEAKGGEPGQFTDQALQALSQGGTLTPGQLAAAAQEKQANFRLTYPNAIGSMAAKAALGAVFATAAGLMGGAALGPLLGAGATGLGAGGSAAAVPTTGMAALGLSATPAALSTGTAIGGGVTSGAVQGLMQGRGDLDALWQPMLTGAVTGGVGAGVPYANSGSINALRGAGISGATDLLKQGLKGDGLDWQELAMALGSGAGSSLLTGRPEVDASGKTTWTEGLTGTHALDQFLARSAQTGAQGIQAMTRDPLANVNAQLDRAAVARETAIQDQMVKAQAEWKRRYGEAQAEAMAAAQEQMRGQQQAYEEKLAEFNAKKAEYEAKYQAFLDARNAQIAQALERMGAAQPSIAQLIKEYETERQKALDERTAAEEKQRSALIQSRQFFPSELLEPAPATEQTSALGAQAAPPPVQFGAGSPFPTSYTSPGQQPLQFSTEGFLPSGAMQGVAAPAVNPLAAPRRRVPSLLSALSRAPYVGVA